MSPTLPLIDLISALTPAPSLDPNIAALPITAITADSRQVTPGALFVAISGTKADGSQFIKQAVEKGAVAVVCTAPVQGVVSIIVSNSRLALAQLAAAFYPKQPEFIAAVTGTDGKTSTAEFTRQLWELCGKKAASIGTLGVKGEGGQELYPGINTTPDPVQLHRILQELAEASYTHVCMEASSHGLDQYRLHGVRVRAAAFTNLARDHMDYHGDEEAYFTAKALLFSDFPLEAAVINVDDPRAAELESLCQARKVPYTIYGQTLDLWDGVGEQRFIIKQITPLAHGQKVVVSACANRKLCFFGLFEKTWDREFEFTVPLVGSFQVFNMLAALGMVYSSGEKNVEKLIDLLPQLKGVRGRMEPVAVHPSGAPIFVDYAHTPAALEKALKTLRPHTQKRLIVVFGCGGDRDPGKRPLMGKAACEQADVVIVTDDNPRSEDPWLIREAVMAGCADAKAVAGREQAIYGALELLAPGDVLLVAGKGHETTQTIGDEVLPFDDAEVIRKALGQ